jgi:hypothetical protein
MSRRAGENVGRRVSVSGEVIWKKEFMGSGGPNGSDRRGAGACRVGLAREPGGG